MLQRWLPVLALVALAAAVQWRTVERAVVPALDVVRYVEMAEQVESEGPSAAIQRQIRPLFPLAIALVHRVGEAWCATLSSPVPAADRTPNEQPRSGDDTEDSAPGSSHMAARLAAAQRTAALCLVLAVVPFTFFCGQFTSWRSALAAGFLFCLTPELARLGADGIADPLHLLLATAALGALAAYFRSGVRTATPAAAYAPCCWWLAPAGASVALAALVRRECLLLIPCWFVIVGGLQLTRRGSQAPRRLLAGAACLAIGFLSVWGPYAWQLASFETAWQRLISAQDRPGLETAADATPLRRWKSTTDDGQRMSFVKKDPEDSIRYHGFGPAACDFAGDLAKGVGWWALPLAAWGWFRLRRRRLAADPGRPSEGANGNWHPLLASPALRFLELFAVAFSATAVTFAARNGYLAPRHLALLIVMLLGLAGEGVVAAGAALAAWLRFALQPGFRRLPGSRAPRPTSARWAQLGTATVLALAGTAGLVRLSDPLHQSRQAHRDAGLWLAEHAEPAAAVLDTRGWAALLSGRPAYSYEQGMRAFSDRRLRYVVVERHERERETGRGQTLQNLLDHAGRCVATFEPQDGRPGKAVEIYRWDAERFTARYRRKARTPAQTVSAVRGSVDAE